MPEQTDIDPENKPSPGKRRRLPKISRRGVVVTGVIIIAVVVLAFAGSKIVERDPNHLGKVGDHIVTKDEVRALEEGVRQAGFYPETQEQLLNLAMGYHLDTQVAKEYELEVSEEEALNNLKARTSHIKPAPHLAMENQYVKYRAYRDILSAKLPLLMQSQQSGRFIVANFDKNFDKSLNSVKSLTEEEHKAIMKQDKDYATDFINKLYKDIKSSKITFDQAMERERKDPKLGEKAISASFHSDSFNKQKDNKTIQVSSITITGNPEIYEKIKDLKAGEMSEPFYFKSQSGPAEGSPRVDSAWMIVIVDEVHNTGPQFDNVLEAQQYFKQKYGYELYK